MAIMETVEIGEVIGRNVAKLMKERGWTQGQLASRSECSQPTLSELTTGNTDEPKLSLLLRIASALDVSIERLYEGWTGPTPAVSEMGAQHLSARLDKVELDLAEIQKRLGLWRHDADLRGAVDRRVADRRQTEARQVERPEPPESEIGGAQ